MAEGQLVKQSTSATISFTLPISCQICLGKVRQPVVCRNQHVFCTVCMDIWLQNNQQCPTCRIPITPDFPCRPILGGTHHDQCESAKSNLSTPSIRKARFDVLYQDYENEIQRLESQIEVLQKQNKGLTKRLEVGGSGDASILFSKSKESSPRTKSEKKGCELDTLMGLTEKLEDATRMYESIKNDMDQLKEKNVKLEQDNENFQLENNKLRQEFSNRSPYKYGRYTVAAQQTKLEQYEREIKQLKRALKTSDDYIDELEVELEKLKKSGGYSQSQNKSTNRAVKNDEQDRNLSSSSGINSMSTENSHQNISDPASSSQQYDHYNHWSERRKLPDLRKLTAAVSEDDHKDKDSYTEQSSLSLEQPTPMTPASFLSRLSLDKSSDKSINYKTSSTPIEPSDLIRETLESTNSKSSSRRRLNFDDDSRYRVGLESSGFWASCQSDNNSVVSSQVPNDSFQLEQPNDMSSVGGDFDGTLTTTEFEDCTRLMAEAARRVEQRRFDSSDSDHSNTRYSDTMSSDAVQQDLYVQNTMSGSLSLSQLQNSVPFPSRPESTPGFLYDKQYSSQHTSSTDNFLNVQRPKSAPGLGEPRPNALNVPLQSGTCNSITFDTVTSNIWKPLGGSYPNIARYNQPKSAATASSNSSDQAHFMPSPVRQLWPVSHNNRSYTGNMTDTAPPGYPQMPFSTNSSALSTSNYNRAVGSVSYPKPIGHMPQFRSCNNSVLPQPLRAMHHLPTDIHVVTQTTYAGLVDNRKRKPEMFTSQGFNNLQEPTGCYSPAKTKKL
ncbi:uncharacterized protein LOC144438978 [Glandiceps talaboti]